MDSPLSPFDFFLGFFWKPGDSFLILKMGGPYEQNFTRFVIVEEKQSIKYRMQTLTDIQLSGSSERNGRSQV